MDIVIELSEQAQAALRFQSYTSLPPIEGVSYQPLNRHRSLEGDFMELYRLSGGLLEGSSELELRQISVSCASPGRINAFHLHPKRTQDEFWTVLEGRMLVWLIDLRRGSPTEGVKRPFLLASDSPGLLYIPSGVAHGYRAGSAGATLLYAMNAQFDPKDPNEGRLPWDHFGAELWEDDRG